jgi:hypothetical protein
MRCLAAKLTRTREPSDRGVVVSGRRRERVDGVVEDPLDGDARDHNPTPEALAGQVPPCDQLIGERS